MDTAQLTQLRQPFDHPEFLFELKHDGFRALAYISDGQCELISRRRNSYKSFGELRSRLARLKVKNAVIDGEIVCLDSEGRSIFNELLFRRGCPIFYAFDLLYLNDRDLRQLPLIERKARLRQISCSPAGQRSAHPGRYQPAPLHRHLGCCGERPRLQSRIRARVEVELSSPNGPSSNEITLTENVSRHGARVVTKRRWQPSDGVIVKWRGNRHSLARIAYCKPLKRGCVRHRLAIFLSSCELDGLTTKNVSASGSINWAATYSLNEISQSRGSTAKNGR